MIAIGKPKKANTGEFIERPMPKMRDRKSVVQGKSVDLGGRRIMKKKKRKKKRSEEGENKRVIQRKRVLVI